MKKARLIFSPLDYEYQKKYGIMPDFDYLNYRKTHTADEAGAYVQQRADSVWSEMKARHEQEMKRLESENPFLTT